MSQQWAAAHVLSGERCTIGWVRLVACSLCRPFPASPDAWGVVVMLVVRVVWVPEWMIVPLARVVWALA